MAKSEKELALAATYEKLVHAARQASQRAYAPYTNKPQGAAVLTSSGEIFCGVTVEMCTYGLSIAAEINAVSQAVAQGHRHFKALAIYPYSSPSGLGRQFIAEFGINVDLIKITDGGVQVIPLKDLLPFHFGPENMGLEKDQHDATSSSAK